MSNPRTATVGPQGPLSIVKAQINFLVTTITDEALGKNEKELTSLITNHGPEASKHWIRRLFIAAASVINQSTDVPPPTSPAILNLRLLNTEIHKLAKDPSASHTLREALQEGLIDPTTGMSEVFRVLDLNTFLKDQVQLDALERLILCSDLIRIISTNNGKGLDIGLGALRILKEALPDAVDILRNGGGDSLGPMQISSWLGNGVLIGDWSINLVTGEVGIGDSDGTRDKVVSTEAQRELVRAIGARLGSGETAASIVAHALDNIEFSPYTSAAQILHRLSPDLTFCTYELVRVVLSRYSPLEALSTSSDTATANQAVTEFIISLLNLATSTSSTDGVPIDAVSIIRAINEFLPNVAWNFVIRSLDSTSAGPIPDTWALRLLASILMSAPGAANALWEHWTNPNRQLTLLERLLYLSPEVFNPIASGHRVIAASDVAGSNPTIKELAVQAQNSVWNCLELTQTLVRLSELVVGDSTLAMRVKSVLERGIKLSPDLLLIALIVIEKPWNTLHSELCAHLLKMFLRGHPGHQLVFYRMWQLDQRFLHAALTDWYAENELNVTRVLDIASDLKILDVVLDYKPFHFSLDIAALSARRELLNLDKWLDNAISAHGSVLIKGILDFLSHKVRYELARNEMDPIPESNTLTLPAATISTFLRGLRYHHELFTPEDVEMYKEVRMQCLQLHPRLMNFVPGVDQEPGMAVYAFPPEIESEADTAYRQLYDGEASVEDIIRLLQRAKESNDPRSHQFFACMCCTLYEEKRFFNTYPIKELTLTAYLFGSLIQYNHIEGVPLSIAVRYVLDALRNPPESNWFVFGIKSLSRFHARLSEWPPLAQAILNIPLLPHTHPEVVGWARAALAQGSDETLDSTGADVVKDLISTEVNEPPVFTALKIKIPEGEEEPAPAPDSETSERILFIINNLAPSNLEAKVADMAERIRPDVLRWLANYLVASRVSIEPNNHTLYINFMDQLEEAALARYALQETYLKIASLLNSEKTVQSSTERTLLKNLGSWLGLITLAKNKPIKHANISFKDLLIEGYDSKRLIVAIPFVCKVLEQVAKSRVFIPPNPWTMAILQLLVELYNFADIKLNLKFEIEVLCKSLNLDLKDIEPTSILRSRPVKAEVPAVPAEPPRTAELERFGGGTTFAPAGPLAEAGRLGLSSLSQAVAPSRTSYAPSLQDTINNALQQLSSYIIFPPHLTVFANNLALKRLVHAGIDRAIREIIAPVVERSVTIAGISTRELISKDFAMEGDEDKMSKAAHLMVKNLAGSLALVTCKDPLRTSMITNMRSALLENGFTEGTLPEQAIIILVNENLELGCSVVEKVAMEKARFEVDEGLSATYASRRKHRERSNQPFWDTSAMAASHYSGMLPDPLRLKLGGLTGQQLQVYEDFGHSRGVPALPPSGTVPLDLRRLTQRAGTPLGRPDSPAESSLVSAPHFDTAVTAQHVIDKFNQLLSQLENAIVSETVLRYRDLPDASEIPNLVTQCTLITARSPSKVGTGLAAAQRVVQYLYRTELPLARDVYVILLHRLCNLEQEVSREVIDWILFADDERKLNVPVTLAMIIHGLINVVIFDAELAKFVSRDFKSSIVDFAAQFARACLLVESPVATREQLINSLDALLQASRHGKATDAALDLINELRGPGQVAPRSKIDEDSELRERLTVHFLEWVRIFEHSTSADQAFLDYARRLQDQGVFRGEEISSLFFRVCVEVSIDSYIKSRASNQGGNGHFLPIDAFARLLVCMIKYHADPAGGISDHVRAHYANKVIGIVVLVLSHFHESMGVHFQQKPFFRFFSSFLANLNTIESHLGGAYDKILLGLSEHLNTLQPLYFPGWSFSWLALLSHRLFMPRLIEMKGREGSVAFTRLFVCLLRFLAPFLRRGLSVTTRALLDGTFKVLLILLHDFPTFLATHATTFLCYIPPSCIQLQNTILSAFPRDVRLVDPFIEVNENLQPMLALPSVSPEYLGALQNSELKVLADKLIASHSTSHVPSLLSYVAYPEQARSNANENRYNWTILVAFTIHLCESATANNEIFSVDSTPAAILISLLKELDIEGRYLLLSTLTCLLRWPNSHTEWAKAFLLECYQDSELDIKEIICRIVLERLVVAKPHPHGLLSFTFDLFRHQNVLDEIFVQKNPEINAIVKRIQTTLTPTPTQI